MYNRGQGIYTTIHDIDQAPAGVLGLEAANFRERFGNTAEQLRHEYMPYDNHSQFIACWEKGRISGVMRITWGRAGALKTLSDLSRHPWHLDPRAVAAGAGIRRDRTLDVTTVAVNRLAAARSGGRAMEYLCFELFRVSLSCGAGVETLTAMLDDRVLALLESRGIHFDPIPGTWPAEYLGSPSTSPVFARIDDLVRHMAQERIAALAA